MEATLGEKMLTRVCQIQIFVILLIAGALIAQVGDTDKRVFLRLKTTLHDTQARIDKAQRQIGEDQIVVSSVSRTLAEMRTGFAKTCLSAGKVFEEEPTPACK